MNARTVLSKPDIDAFLARYPRWAMTEKKLTCTVRGRSFGSLRKLVDQFCDLAEEMNHHPELLWVYRTLEIRLETHDAGGVTQLDLDLAGLMDPLIASHV